MLRCYHGAVEIVGRKKAHSGKSFRAFYEILENSYFSSNSKLAPASDQNITPCHLATSIDSLSSFNKKNREESQTKKALSDTKTASSSKFTGDKTDLTDLKPQKGLSPARLRRSRYNFLFFILTVNIILCRQRKEKTKESSKQTEKLSESPENPQTHNEKPGFLTEKAVESSEKISYIDVSEKNSEASNGISEDVGRNEQNSMADEIDEILREKLATAQKILEQNTARSEKSTSRGLARELSSLFDSHFQPNFDFSIPLEDLAESQRFTEKIGRNVPIPSAVSPRLFSCCSKNDELSSDFTDSNNLKFSNFLIINLQNFNT